MSTAVGRLLERDVLELPLGEIGERVGELPEARADAVPRRLDVRQLLREDEEVRRDEERERAERGAGLDEGAQELARRALRVALRGRDRLDRELERARVDAVVRLEAEAVEVGGDHHVVTRFSLRGPAGAAKAVRMRTGRRLGRGARRRSKARLGREAP